MKASVEGSIFKHVWEAVTQCITCPESGEYEALLGLVVTYSNSYICYGVCKNREGNGIDHLGLSDNRR